MLALLCGGISGAAGLAVAGAVLAAAADLIGVLQARSRHGTPAERGMRGAAEAAPAIGMAAYQPAAIGLTIVVVLYALLASGIQTVGAARGVPLPMTWGESLRRILTSVACTAALAVPLAGGGWLSLRGVEPRGLLAWLITAAAAAGAAALVEMWTKIGLAGNAAPAPNVDR